MTEQETRQEVIATARLHVGVRERGMNRGVMVEKFLASVGLGGGYAWCAAFVYYVLRSAGLGHLGPKKGKAAVRNWAVWASDEGRLIPARDVQPGDMFFWLNDDGTGHIGFVENMSPKSALTIEGNTNQAGSREGDGVYVKSRPLTTKILFIKLWKGQ